MGPKPLTTRARIALMAAWGWRLSRLGNGRRPDTSSIPTAENAKSKSDKSKATSQERQEQRADTKSKDAKSKDQSPRMQSPRMPNPRTKHPRTPIQERPRPQSDPRRARPRRSLLRPLQTVPYNGPPLKPMSRASRRGRTGPPGQDSQATDEQHAISDPGRASSWNGQSWQRQQQRRFPRYAASSCQSELPAIGALPGEPRRMLWSRTWICDGTGLLRQGAARDRARRFVLPGRYGARRRAGTGIRPGPGEQSFGSDLETMRWRRSAI